MIPRLPISTLFPYTTLFRSGEHLRVFLRVDTLDLPDVDLDTLVLEVLDDATHELRTQLGVVAVGVATDGLELGRLGRDRKSTRLNSSHPSISYAVFCLKKKK